MIGDRVGVLASGRREAGTYSVQYDASGLASGIYLYRLTTQDKKLTRKMIVVK